MSSGSAFQGKATRSNSPGPNTARSRSQVPSLLPNAPRSSQTDWIVTAPGPSFSSTPRSSLSTRAHTVPVVSPACNPGTAASSRSRSSSARRSRSSLSVPSAAAADRKAASPSAPRPLPSDLPKRLDDTAAPIAIAADATAAIAATVSPSVGRDGSEQTGVPRDSQGTMSPGFQRVPAGSSRVYLALVCGVSLYRVRQPT
jgi:hypothetical protein